MSNTSWCTQPLVDLNLIGRLSLNARSLSTVKDQLTKKAVVVWKSLNTHSWMLPYKLLQK